MHICKVLEKLREDKLLINLKKVAMNINLKEIRDKIQENLNIWALVPLSLLERAQVAKNYICVHLNF